MSGKNWVESNVVTFERGPPVKFQVSSQKKGVVFFWFSYNNLGKWLEKKRVAPKGVKELNDLGTGGWETSNLGWFWWGEQGSGLAIRDGEGRKKE